MKRFAFNIFSILVTFIYVLFFCYISIAQIKPARMFSDNMVLQREAAIAVWGTANPGDKIVVQIGSSEAETMTQPDGRWMVNLAQLSAGGPYVLKIKGSRDKIEFKNVLIGDVWFASGQSNMEHPMKGWEYIPHSAVDHSEKEIADSNYPEIRLFSVPKFPSSLELKDLPEGRWEVAGPESVAGFSSTAWFFGKELYQELKVPIGIINCSWGGAPIQTWMSRESLEHFKDSVDLPVIPDKFDEKEWAEKVTESIEKNRVRRNQISYPKLGLPEEINNSGFDNSFWKSVNLLDEGNRFGNIVWLRKNIIVPELFAQQKLKLSLGFLNRQSQVYLNGKELDYFLYPQPVKIEISRELVRSGENILTIRLAQPFGESQVMGSPEQFFLSNIDQSFSCNIVEGWKANDGLEPVMPIIESYQNNPAFLFNGMVAPVIPYRIKGFIWYQGESDAGRPQLYEQMFRQLIVDWRKLWSQGDLPFLFVQTSNIEQSHEFDKKSDSWCLLREAQQKALSLPHTGMAVSLDMGNLYDVHPKNKQEFGHRLALQAYRIAYHRDVIADGPTYESVEIKGDTMVVWLKYPSSRLIAKNPKDLSGFEIAGKDRLFQEAKACLKGNSVYLFSAHLRNPVAVRYAWTNNPKCCLFNKEGLPLAPFSMNINEE